MGQRSNQRMQDSLAIAAKASAGYTFGTTTVVPIVGQLLVAAGVQSAFPGIGWITAGITAAVAGTIALVIALRAGHKRRQEAVAQAEQLGIPDAAEVPGFVVQALNNGPAWRGERAGKLVVALQKDAAKGRLDKKSSQKDASRLRILMTIDLLERADERGTPAVGVPPAAPVTALAREYGSRPMTVEGYLGVDGTTLLGGLALIGVIGFVGYTLSQEK